MMWWYGNGMGLWGLGLMTVGNLLLWALIVLGVLALLRRRGHIGEAQPRRTAEELLAERFAGGEITEDEYGRRLDVLRRRSPAHTER